MTLMWGPSGAAPAAKERQAPLRPRLGFLGVGSTGRQRMRAIAHAGAADVVAIADESPDARLAARDVAPSAECVASLDALDDGAIDGVVIGTPTALHATQAIAALERGLAVFCQRPLARTAKETRRVIDAARANDRLLGVDLTYRYTAGLRLVRDLAREGELGQVYAVDLVFHSASGPDTPWWYDPRLSGGGCMMDLGIHLVDAALWVLDFPAVERTSARLFAHGTALSTRSGSAEEYAEARLDLATGTAVRVACSWRLPAGREAVFEAAFYGTAGGAAMRNVNGSLHDFVAEHFRGTSRERLAQPPDDWCGRAAVVWARRLAASAHYDPSCERLVDTAQALDRIYGR